MSKPQDPRVRRKQKARRAKKNAEYTAKKAAEDKASMEQKKPAAAVSKSGR
jgi:hypothetical protein